MHDHRKLKVGSTEWWVVRGPPSIELCLVIRRHRMNVAFPTCAMKDMRRKCFSWEGRGRAHSTGEVILKNLKMKVSESPRLREEEQ